MTHTPGPWEVNTAGVGEAGGKIEINEYYVYAPGAHDDVAIASDVADPSTGEPSESNANIIAAAPDMLDVLKELAYPDDSFGIYDLPLLIQDRIRAAIAKAEGKK